MLFLINKSSMIGLLPDFSDEKIISIQKIHKSNKYKKQNNMVNNVMKYKYNM